MKRLAAILCLLSAPAFAQSNPSFITGQIPTATQWNSYFGKKADVTGGTINSGVLNSVTINGSLGGSPTVGGVWTASNATLSGFGITGGTLGGSITGTGATITGGTFSGITLSGTVAGTPTFTGPISITGNGTIGGNGFVTGVLTLGSNTAGKSFNINGATNSSGSINFQIAGVNRHQFTWISTTDLDFRALDNTGANPVTWLRITNTTGLPTFKVATTFAAPVSFAPGNIIVSGSDSGTAGVSQVTNATATISGTTTSLTPFIISDNNFNVNGKAPNGYTGTRYFLKAGGPSLDDGGGALVMELTLNMNGDVPTLQSGTGFYAALLARTVIQNSNVASAEQIEAINPGCSIQSSTGWTGGITCIEIDHSVHADASPVVSSQAIGISNNHFNAQQGQLVDAGIAFWTSLPDTGAHPVGWRDLFRVGTAAWALNPYNGALLSTGFQTVHNLDTTAMVPNAGAFGFDLSSFAPSGAQMRWSGGKIASGEFDANFLRITQGASGPVLDATNQCAAAAGMTWVSGTGFFVGEQISDRLGGNLVIDTVDGSGKPLTWHQPTTGGTASQPCILSGETRIVSRAWTIAPTPSGANVLNIGQESNIAVGDTLVAPSTTGVVPGGTTVASFTTVNSLTTTAPSVGAVLTFASTTGVTDGVAMSGMNVAPGAIVSSHTATTVTMSLAAINTGITSGIPITFYKAAILSANLTGTLLVNTPIYFTLTGIPANPIVMFGGSGAGTGGGTGSFNYTWTAPTQMQIGASVNTLVGSGSALATNATTGMLLIPSMAGTPTGNVGALGGVALNYDSTNKKLCVTIGATVECSAAFTP